MLQRRRISSCASGLLLQRMWTVQWWLMQTGGSMQTSCVGARIFIWLLHAAQYVVKCLHVRGAIMDGSCQPYKDSL